MNEQNSFSKDGRCDNCGKTGTFNFSGDDLCGECVSLYSKIQDNSDNSIEDADESIIAKLEPIMTGNVIDSD